MADEYFRATKPHEQAAVEAISNGRQMCAILEDGSCFCGVGEPLLLECGSNVTVVNRPCRALIEHVRLAIAFAYNGRA